jgi:hypothetical protein
MGRSAMDASRRDLMKAAAALIVDQWAAPHRFSFAEERQGASPGDERKVIVVCCAGVRREETFQHSGLENIPHLFHDLLPRSVFYPYIGNHGVTSHYNTISSIITGNWQRLDDWGKTPPASPTIFEHLRKRRRLPQDKTWLISSNKALTSQIGASSVSDFGQPYGANVVFPKQLLINAVIHAASQGHPDHSANRSTMQTEIEAILRSEDYEGLGWSVLGNDAALDRRMLASVQDAIADLVRTAAAVTGDEFTFLVSLEVMKRFAPSLLVITFSDVEVAHFGSYSMYVSGIRTMDRLIYELWSFVQSTPGYKDKTTLFVLPEFGRDLDGSNTNGFFNHRLSDESTRTTWMMCLGEAAGEPQVVERPVEHIDLCPTIAKLLDVGEFRSTGSTLPELKA